MSVSDIAQKIQMQKMGTVESGFTPSLPIKTIPLTSKFQMNKTGPDKNA